MPLLLSRRWIPLACLFSLLTAAQAEVRVHPLIGSGMVLQRWVPNEIWGWADAGEAVHVRWGDETQDTVAAADGNWSVTFGPRDAGGPGVLTVAGENTLTFEDVYVGDVWVCSGQSNMELPMARLKERYPITIAAADNPSIRHFAVPQTPVFTDPQSQVTGGVWKAATPQNVLGFSGVAYFFALEHQRREGVPVGLINASLGGSPIEAWMSEEALAGYPDALAEGKRWRDADLIARTEAKNQEINRLWYGRLENEDPGLHAPTPWFAEALPLEGWGRFNVPGKWEDQGIPGGFGSVWFRRTFTVPPALAGVPARLDLGTIIDADTTYINGQKVGETGYQYPPRRYVVPAGLLRAGENTIVIRALRTGNPGAFTADKPFHLFADDFDLDLRGEWLWRVGAELPAIEPTVFVRWKPMGLYNGMIAPLHRTSIQGVLWYQGESNLSQPKGYADKLATMIEDWRGRWANGQFALIVAQLPVLGAPQALPAEGNWAVLRDEQRRAVEQIPLSALAVAIDLGEWNDIHPTDKREVGRRMDVALAALVRDPDQHPGAGPMPKHVSRDGHLVRIDFHSVLGGQLLTRDGQPPQGFALAGADGVFHAAEARLIGTSVEVSSSAVMAPVRVRYAWADNPLGDNLIDGSGLPASPFELNTTEATE